MSIHVTVWNEFHDERIRPAVAAVYPHGIHAAIREGLEEHGFANVRTATLDEPEHGLSAAVLDATDVLIWWGHRRHDDVADAAVARVRASVLAGMGLIVLHSAHNSKIFKLMCGTGATLSWRDQGETERVWVAAPGHPIAEGIDRYFELAREEMYGEPFEIPNPDQLVFISWFRGGEVFRSGCCYRRGRGRMFYFRPGHETFPTYFQAPVRRVIANAVRWAAPPAGVRTLSRNIQRPPIEPIG